jgi:hypothetical protein
VLSYVWAAESSSYEENLALAEQMGRVEIGTNDVDTVLKLPSDDPVAAGGPSECPICLEAPVDVVTICNHGFCDTCIRRWLAGNHRCPLCLKDFNDPACEQEGEECAGASLSRLCRSTAVARRPRRSASV